MSTGGAGAAGGQGPSWLDHGSQPGIVGPQVSAAASRVGAAASSAAAAVQHQLEPYLPACAKYFIPVSRVINMGLACLMAFAAVNGIMKIVEFRLDTVFVAVYMLVFAAILFLFELCQFKYIACIDNVFRRNFGFMYGSRAKALYIIFIAFLNFGLMSTGSIQLAAGILLAADGIFMLVATFKYPSLFQGNAPPEGQQAAPSHATAPVAVKGPGNV